MNTKYLHQIQPGDQLIVGKVSMRRILVSYPDLIHEYEDISDRFEGVDFKPFNENLVQYIHVGRSIITYDDLEINYVIQSREESGMHARIDQVVNTSERNSRLHFVCPLWEEGYLQCDELFLRADFPLFGSAKALNIAVNP